MFHELVIRGCTKAHNTLCIMRSYSARVVSKRKDATEPRVQRESGKLLQIFGVKVWNTIPLSFQMGGITRRI